MGRYSNTRVKINNNSKRVYSYTLYPKIKLKNSDIFITPKYSERLDILANKYYDDPSLWWIIAQANNLGKGKLSIPLGKQLRIPSDVSTIIADLQKINK